MLNTKKKNTKKEHSISSLSSDSESAEFLELDECDINNIFVKFNEEKAKTEKINTTIKMKGMAPIAIEKNKPLKAAIMEEIKPKLVEEETPIIIEEKIKTIMSDSPKITYDKIQNKYIIEEQDGIKTILLSDVINSILNAETNDANIKKYLFIISFNSITSQNEYNFMPSILTENIDMLVELESSIFTIINNDDFETRELKHKTNLILFFYQIVMFIYKASFTNYDKEKLRTIYNVLCYRFSLIILKQIYNLKDEMKYLNENFKEAVEIKNKLELKLFGTKNMISENTELQTENMENTESNILKGGHAISVDNDLSSVSSRSSSFSIESDDTSDSYNSSSASDNASYYETSKK